MWRVEVGCTKTYRWEFLAVVAVALRTPAQTPVWSWAAGCAPGTPWCRSCTPPAPAVGSSRPANVIYLNNIFSLLYISLSKCITHGTVKAQFSWTIWGRKPGRQKLRREDIIKAWTKLSIAETQQYRDRRVERHLNIYKPLGISDV